MPLAVALAVAGTACGGGGAEDRGVRVVVTTTILGDLAQRVAGDEATVEALIPAGTDPHEFSPSARQAALLREADLVVANGLGLEEGLAATLHQVAEERGNVLELAPKLDPLPLEDGGGDEEGEHEEEESHEDEGFDPHVWMDPVRMADGVVLIAERLESVAPGGWRGRAEVLRDELLGLDDEIARVVAAVPAEQRALVTNHEALDYFADRYGFQVVGTVIPGVSTLAEPSGAAIAELARLIVERDVPAVFAETTQSTELARTLAEETGREVAVVELFTESLGEPGSGAETYVDMMRTDAELIVEALTG